MPASWRRPPPLHRLKIKPCTGNARTNAHTQTQHKTPRQPREQLPPLVLRFCVESCKVATPSIWEEWAYLCQWMPRPMRHLQALLVARGFDLADQRRRWGGGSEGQ